MVDARLRRFLDDHTEHLRGISPELAPLTTFADDLLSGGKRFRALFCYWGWQAARDPLSTDETGATAPSTLATVVDAAAALELFHAAALVHDDIIDNSDTRRGRPAAHRRFEKHHRDAEWAGDAARFGTSAATLLGDLLLVWSDELFEEALRGVRTPEAASRARQEFQRMRTEVTAGQYLDVVEELAWRAAPDETHLDRARQVVLYKSAKYSVEAPLVIGAALGGAPSSQRDSLRAFGVPLGMAFQLRDDLLGVFGDPEVTGKPAGDDLREGKRTVLVAIARSSVPAGTRNTIDELLGDPDLDDAQVSLLQQTFRDCGAEQTLEDLIAAELREALTAITAADIHPAAQVELSKLADRASRRDS